MPTGDIAASHDTGGAAIRALRTGAGLSLRQLAGAVGISHSHLVRFERGERDVSTETLTRLIHAIATSRLDKAS